MALQDISAVCGAFSVHALVLAVAYLVQRVAAQAPVNDVISWPSGLLLLATVIYAAVVRTTNQLWAADPAIGPFLLKGWPFMNVGTRYDCQWSVSSCHIMSEVRPAFGSHACWLCAEQVEPRIREAALARAEKVLSCVTWYDIPGAYRRIPRQVLKLFPHRLLRPLPRWLPRHFCHQPLKPPQ
ncbi:hypothetical protein AURDEDRAFT_173255 [Auricularia subglabra TFB-10046 SS5]|uniref:Uncharacterized protein n=1 Tax=Auricularia subglabra (strain TFB-10046 / SS5) TaxID=717982 RepID=J0WUW5_AURST|nr:hypothetical protein AURDEDRAFT_173255 [Auricularia subglabra TFB-10046 SS5]